MPLFEYICKNCKKRFEALVYGDGQPHCPLCKGTSLDQQISTFSVGTPKRARAAAACASGGTCSMAGGPCACPMD